MQTQTVLVTVMRDSGGGGDNGADSDGERDGGNDGDNDCVRDANSNGGNAGDNDWQCACGNRW